MNYKKFYNVIYDDKGRRHWKPLEQEISDRQVPEEKKRIVNIDFSKPLEARSEDKILLKPVGAVKIDKDLKESEKHLGYYCKLCNFSASDNHSWLDHLNSFDHNRHLGNHMKVEKITPDSVASHLSNLSHKRAKKPPPKLEDILKRLEEGHPTKKHKSDDQSIN